MKEIASLRHESIAFTAKTLSIRNPTGVLSHGNCCLYVWVRVVSFELEIVVMEVENGLHVGIDDHFRQRSGLSCELETGLLEVVKI